VPGCDLQLALPTELVVKNLLLGARRVELDMSTNGH